MTLVDQIANAVGEQLGPIMENAGHTIVDGVRQVIRDELIAKFSGKEIIFKIQIPDLTK